MAIHLTMVMMTRPGPRQGFAPAPQQFHDLAGGAPAARRPMSGVPYDALLARRFGNGPLASALHRLDDVLGDLLGVAEQHHGVVAIEQRIVDAGIARSERALDEHHGAGLPDLEHRHAVD